MILIAISYHLYGDDCVIYRTINDENNAIMFQKDIDQMGTKVADEI